MNPEVQTLRTAIYFGLQVEVIHQMESWALIRFGGGKFVVDTTDLVADPDMAAKPIETPELIIEDGDSDCRKWMGSLLEVINRSNRHSSRFCSIWQQLFNGQGCFSKTKT